MQNVLMQKQAFQMELGETINALEEIKNTNESIYKLVGTIMIKADKEKTLESLGEKKRILELRNESLDKQERLFEAKAKEIQGFLRNAINEKNIEKKE
ncbi:MAG: prefoldin subunit [Candidatus Pacearchaeota archaeon]|nr:prefoldin subunit [Candidatus Pacearchaeota archaeon]